MQEGKDGRELLVYDTVTLHCERTPTTRSQTTFPAIALAHSRILTHFMGREESGVVDQRRY
jgi:hypothetical protein